MVDVWGVDDDDDDDAIFRVSVGWELWASIASDDEDDEEVKEEEELEEGKGEKKKLLDGFAMKRLGRSNPISSSSSCTTSINLCFNTMASHDLDISLSLSLDLSLDTCKQINQINDRTYIYI